MNQTEFDRLTHLINNCERRIDQQRYRVSNSGSTIKSICHNNPLYGLKHCLHTINDETKRLDRNYVLCLLQSEDAHMVRKCFKQLKKDVDIFTKNFGHKCDVKSCKVADISKAALSCCINATDEKALTNCFNKMIKGPLAGNIVNSSTTSY